MEDEFVLDNGLIGKTVLDKYEITKKISDEGYTSIVYKAKQVGIDQDRVVKILRPEHKTKTNIVDQLTKEVTRQARLTHRNIVKIIDYGHYNKLPVVVQEYVEKGNLRKWLKNKKRNPPTAGTILQVIEDILSAVYHMHSQKKPLMHMDIKPENILVSADGSFKLADFGLAKQQGGRGKTFIAGTFDYMHPDLHNVEELPRNKLRPIFDCYSIGCLIQKDLVTLFKKVSSKDDYEFLKLIANKAKGDKGKFYKDIFSIQKDLDKLQHRYLLSTKVDEFSLRTSFIPTLRIPTEIDVNTTKRVIEMIEGPYFQRLRNIRQIGPAHLVYPGAIHTRFEHSLGCYNNARRYLEVLLRQPRFSFAIEDESDVLAVLLAALLHDIGHYPFSHPVEDGWRIVKGTKGDVPELRHEHLAKNIIFGTNLPPNVIKSLGVENSQLAELIKKDWGVDPEMVCRLISGDELKNDKEALLSSIINGPIDADKMDYLERDSIHAGVPYGRYIDKNRFFASLTMNQTGNAICLTDKGRIAAETFIFCRYAMTSEVYWHHAVRAANAMIINAIKILIHDVGITNDELLEIFFLSDDQTLLNKLAQRGGADEGLGKEAAKLLRALIAPDRKIYKRLVTYSKIYNEAHKQQVFDKILYCETSDLMELQEEINKVIAKRAGLKPNVEKYIALIDVPPKDKDVFKELDIVYPRVKMAEEKQIYKLSELSYIAKVLGEDFQRSVKKIRIFCRGDVAKKFRDESANIQQEISKEITKVLR